MSSIVVAGDTSGTITVSAPAVSGSNTLTLPVATGTLIHSDGSGNLQANSGYGSVATGYLCRAWVNFNGTGTVAIRASGNVSSITDNGTGDYTVNMTTAMPDINYSYSLSTMAVTHATTNSINQNASANEVAQTTTAFRFVTRIVGGGGVDTQYNNVSVFR